MEIHRHSGIYTLTTQQLLNAPIDKVWDFFSNPENLEKLTATELKFQITSAVERMYPGQIITYRIKLSWFYKVNWVTEITQVEKDIFFIDEQRKGPYRIWHHEHRFIQVKEGVLMQDKITFALPFGLLGHLAYRLYIKKKLSAIFQFRAQAAAQQFR